MALSATVLDEYRLAHEKSNLDAKENRMAMYGAYETAVRDREITIPGYQEFISGRASAARTASIVFLNKFTPTSSATRSCTANTEEATSAYVTPSWTTIETGFMMVPAQNVGNYVSYQAQINNQMKGVERVFLEAVDTAVITHVEAAKTTTNAADDNPFNVSGDSMVVPLADHDTYLNEIHQIYMQNDYPVSPMNLICSPRASSIHRLYSNQGAGNATNYAFQFADFTFGYTNNITVSATNDIAIVYAMPEGTLAYLSWVDIDAKLGHSAGASEWFTAQLPLLGHEVGVYYVAACADKHALLSGLDRTKADSWEFSFDYSVVSATVSTGAAPIFKFDLQSV